MAQEIQFLHVGLTVADFDRTAAFYQKYFGGKLLFKKQFSAEFIAEHRVLYGQQEGVYSWFGFMELPGGVVLELFEFSQQRPAAPAEWNRPGYHHICLKVADIHGLCAQMKADGVEFYFDPAPRGKPGDGNFWVFLKDPDGNMIELQ